MLASKIRPSAFVSNRTTFQTFYSTTSTIRPVPILKDGTITTFRNEAFQPAVPFLLPRNHFALLPATKKWFLPSSSPHSHTRLDETYLSSYASAPVPLELTSSGAFTQTTQPLSFFLSACATPLEKGTSVYLAQASLSDLPDGLRADVPTPDLVIEAGRGDVYDTSIWLGLAPTYTPLHRDPNPNLFVQLAGRKKVRLLRPEVGGAVFTRVQEIVGGTGNALIRGGEMMAGKEREVLEEVVWEGKGDAVPEGQTWECELGPGDGLFIPKGWWHSIKGLGEGITGSVNWWFR